MLRARSWKSERPAGCCCHKHIVGENTVIGHVPRIISSLCSLFIRRGGAIKCSVDGNRRYSADLLQGGMEIPCKLVLVVKASLTVKNLRNLF